MGRTIAERLAYNRRYASRLNPLLFNEQDELKPEIKDKILDIVEEFLKYMQVDIRVLDIRLLGSNAAYNYGEHSDLDIHIVTNLSEISDPEIIARLYFDSIKKNFKDSYDIKIKGIEVELYVEDINSSAVSNGIYSVMYDNWIKKPTPIPDPSSEDMDKAEELEDDIINSIKRAKTTDELQEIVDGIYLMRKDALSEYGETGIGNLVFKSLRNKGVLDKIKQVLRDKESKELSLENKEIRESAEKEDAIANCMAALYNRYGSLDGGGCGTVAYYVSEMLDGMIDYSFSGEIVDGALSHIMIKCNGHYYDATNPSGYANTRGRYIVDNLECVEQDINAIPAIIGNDKYGWISCFRSQREFIKIIRDSFHDY